MCEVSNPGDHAVEKSQNLPECCRSSVAQLQHAFFEKKWNIESQNEIKSQKLRTQRKEFKISLSSRGEFVHPLEDWLAGMKTLSHESSSCVCETQDY